MSTVFTSNISFQRRVYLGLFAIILGTLSYLFITMTLLPEFQNLLLFEREKISEDGLTYLLHGVIAYVLITFFILTLLGAIRQIRAYTKEGILYWLCKGLFIGLIFGILVGILDWSWFGMVVGLGFGLSAGMIFAITYGAYREFKK